MQRLGEQMTDDSSKPRGGRVRLNYEQMPARFGEGTMRRIDEHLEPEENRATFVRTAVDNELRRRARRANKVAA